MHINGLRQFAPPPKFSGRDYEDVPDHVRMMVKYGLDPYGNYVSVDDQHAYTRDYVEKGTLSEDEVNRLKRTDSTGRGW